MEKNTHRLEGPLISVISRLDRQESTGNTHPEEPRTGVFSRAQNPAHNGSHSQTGEWRTGIVSRKIQLMMEATHKLENRGQASSVGPKCSSPRKSLTPWRTEDRCGQQSPVHHGSHLLSGEPRTGVICRVQHPAHNRSHSHTGEPMTSISRVQNPAHDRSHSQPGKPRTGIISRVQIQFTMEATHILESRRQVWSAELKCRSPQKPLTSWRAKDRCHQQGPNVAHHGSHSLPEEPRTGIVSKFQIQLTTEATHFLVSQG